MVNSYGQGEYGNTGAYGRAVASDHVTLTWVLVS